jgi:hypothetical protein
MLQQTESVELLSERSFAYDELCCIGTVQAVNTVDADSTTASRRWAGVSITVDSLPIAENKWLNVIQSTHPVWSSMVSRRVVLPAPLDGSLLFLHLP